MNKRKHIPLAYITHKGRFIIHPEKRTVTVMCLPFQGTPTALIWTQDFEGNILQEYPVSDPFVLTPSCYDYEVRESLNTEAADQPLLQPGSLHRHHGALRPEGATRAGLGLQPKPIPRSAEEGERAERQHHRRRQLRRLPRKAADKINTHESLEGIAGSKIFRNFVRSLTTRYL